MESMIGESGDWKKVTTSWAISAGSLADSVTVESSVSPIDEDALVSSPKSPVVLCPPSSDRGPCEITIAFTQRHEVRQVYVRSTARVYEIYYASTQHSGNEYLCTVRCDTAHKNEFLDSDRGYTQATGFAFPVDSIDELAEGRPRSEMNSNSTEDDWVEVKMPKNSLVTSRNDSQFLKSCVKDFYEATAEIADANPCLSLTIRLVSIQSGDHVYVGEIYVFVDPIESDDDENNRVGNTMGTSLMAMLVPSLLQLSKARVAGHAPDKHALDINDNHKSQPTGSEAAEGEMNAKGSETNDNAKRAEYGSGICDTNDIQGSVSEPAQQTLPDGDANRKPDTTYDRFESALEQLVSRVSRIEDLCLRFQENMLKPIGSIEARLQRVEEQLEALNHKVVNPGLQICKRFSAPECILSESNFTSLYESNHEESQFDRVSSSKESVPPDEASDGISASELLPSEHAPDFPHGEDGEESPVPELVADSPKAKTRHALSVDDALASALDGFVSSIAGSPQKYVQALAMKAPEFTNEDDESYEETTSPRIQCDEVPNPSICLADRIECLNDSLSPAFSSYDREGNAARHGSDDCSEKIAEGSVEKRCHVLGIVTGITPNDNGKIEISQGAEASNEVSCALGGECACSEDEMPQSQMDVNSHPVEEMDSLSSCKAFKVTNGKPEVGIPHDLSFSHTACLVDFKIPILDVKFIPQEKSDSNSLLRALWDKKPEPNSILPYNDRGHDSYGEQESLIVVDDAKPLGDAVNSCLSADFDYCSLLGMPVDKDFQKQQNDLTCIQGELLTDSLI